jgi:hypothetical protein
MKQEGSIEKLINTQISCSLINLKELISTFVFAFVSYFAVGVYVENTNYYLLQT